MTTTTTAKAAHDTHAKFKSATDGATALLEDTFATAREGALAIGVKVLEAGKTNSDASFALVKDLFGAKTMSDVMELQSAFARKQFEAFSTQFKEFQGLTEQFVTDTTKPVTDQVEKTFKDLKVA